MLKLIHINSWDEFFFRKFLDFKNKIQADIVNSFPDILDDYQKFFGTGSVFENDFHWDAFLVLNNQEVVGKAILTHKLNSNVGSLGFIDWVNSEEVAKFLIQAVSLVAQERHLRELKTPVDFNFFVKYRIKLPGGGDPFYGEPVYPDYYHDLFRATDFKVIGEWNTFKLDIWGSIKSFITKRKMLSKRSDGSHSKTRVKTQRTTIRCLDMSDWQKEMRTIYDLFIQAYTNMPEFEAISFEQFKIIFEDFRYIVNPFYSYIVELKGKPVAFSINYVDPLPLLLPMKGKKVSKLEKTLFFVKQRLNRGTYLVSHVGKVPGPDGEEIKGVQIQVSNRVSMSAWYMNKLLVTFQNIHSPAGRPFDPEIRKIYSQYVLYGKKLE